MSGDSALSGRSSPSGRQVEIGDGTTSAVVTEVGGGLRALSSGGIEVLDGYASDQVCSGGRGQVLIPWPNRLEDGRYEYGGATPSAALDEPDARNAIHGLVRWLRWTVDSPSPDRAVAACSLAPQPGYPWGIEVSVTYSVGGGSLLTVDVAVSNTGEVAGRAPLGVGFHPYLHAGDGGVDRARLTVPAATRLLADERGIPRAAVPVGGTGHDLRRGLTIGSLRLDDCFTDLPADWSVELERADGLLVELWTEGEWPYVMCYTGDTLPGSERRRGLAVEPMTCPPNALRTGESLVELDPGQSWGARWGIRGR